MSHETNGNTASRLSRRAALKFGASATATGMAAAMGFTARHTEAQSATPAQSAITGGEKMHRIAMEEHFMAPDFIPYFDTTGINISAALRERALNALSDFGDNRLQVMDANGLSYSVLSLAGPGVQIERDTELAKRRATEVNDLLAREIHRRPTRYGGFAHLAMQDPAAAANELERCVHDLKFQGAMINGHTNGEYLDLDKFSVFWERAAALGAPIYIHPTNPVDHPSMYQGHSELWGPVCSWAFETGTHALRLVFAGVFERYPKARVILGHMGETLPISLWRFDSRWLIANQGGRKLQQPPSSYIRRNIAVTTSGVCSNTALHCALEAMGEDNVMFSVDYPFERSELAARFMDEVNVDDAVKRKISHANATRLLLNMA